MLQVWLAFWELPWEHWWWWSSQGGMLQCKQIDGLSELDGYRMPQLSFSFLYNSAQFYKLNWLKRSTGMSAAYVGWFGCRFTPTLSKAASVQDGDLFGYLEWLGCSNWDHFFPTDKKLYKFNFFSLNVSNFMRNSNPLGTGRLIILLFVVSAAFNCFAVFHWVLEEDDGQICINFMSSCATTFSQDVGICWNSNMFSHMEDLWSLYEWLSGSACAGCKNFWKCNSEGLSALIFGLSAMSLGCCARRDSLVLKEIPQEATSFDNSWYSFGWSEVFCFLWAQGPNCFRLSWQV